MIKWNCNFNQWPISDADHTVTEQFVKKQKIFSVLGGQKTDIFGKK